MRSCRMVRVALCVLTALAMLVCDRPEPPSQATSVRCVGPLRRSPAGHPEWHGMPEPFVGLDVRVYWSRAFQTYEVVFRNRMDTTIEFRYWANAADSSTGRFAIRRMLPLTEQLPPGASAPSAASGETLCVAVRSNGINVPMFNEKTSH